MKNHPKIQKKPSPSVIIKDYGDSSIDLVARFWVLTKDGWVKVRSDMIRNFDKAFSEAGIRIPYETFHLETAGDTAEEIRIEEAAQKAMKEKLLQNGNGVQNGNGSTLAPVAIAVETEPEGAYLDQKEIDEQTIDNHG